MHLRFAYVYLPELLCCLNSRAVDGDLLWNAFNLYFTHRSQSSPASTTVLPPRSSTSSFLVAHAGKG